MAWTATVISNAKTGDALKVLLRFTDGTRTFDKEFYLGTENSLTGIAREVGLTMACAANVDALAVNAALQPGYVVTPAAVAKTAKELAGEAFIAAYQRWKQFKGWVDDGLCTAVEADLTTKFNAARAALVTWYTTDPSGL
jgi:hypothetical protein